MITSRYTLDAKNPAFRERLAAEVDLIGAWRLPSGTHQEAGTDVITDLLVLRRPLPADERPEPTWIATTSHEVDGTELVWNQHWAEHPERVLGRVEPGGAYRHDDFHVRADRPTGELLAEALTDAPALRYWPQGAAPALAGIAPTRTATGRPLPAGSIVVDDTSPTGFSRDGTPHRCAAKNVAQLTALCGLRDAALDYLDGPSEEGRGELLGLYLAYRESHPPLNAYALTARAAGKPSDDDTYDEDRDPPRSVRHYPRLEGFRTDPSWWTVAALEDFDDDTHQARPAAVLVRDTMAATPEWPEAAHDIGQAAINSLSRWHRLDPTYIAAQLGVDRGGVAGQLATIAYRDPARKEWVLAERYLAGDVVGKLDAARAAAAGDPRFEPNVADLTSVLPTPLTAAEISAEFGVTWLEPDDIAAFITEHGGGQPRVMYHPPTGEWSHSGWTPAGPAQFHRDNRTMTETVTALCNGRPATVWRDVEVAPGRHTRVIDNDATSAEQLARDNLTEALQAWVWADPARGDRLIERYNRMFNRYVAETWDGSHLTLPGLAEDFQPRPHQKDVVWRILAANDTGTLMAHGVGAGKTAAMVIAGAEARRTGRVAGTTLYAVPGNMVEQFARDYLRLYPADRVITPQGPTVGEATRLFAARVATGDFDAAICSHNVLKRIPLSPALEQQAMERRIAEFETVDPDTTLSRASAKRAARKVEAMRQKLKGIKQAAEDPSAVYFDRMGVGMMFVDEAHRSKNIVLGTDRQGLPIPEGSQTAEAVLARAGVVRAAHGARAVVMATATPVTNSPAEMWVMARLCAPDALAKAGIDRFDAFAANFLSPVDTVELDAGGKLRVVTRLGEYRNFPDLARIFRSFTDVRATASLGFALPALADGEAKVHVSTPTLQQLAAADWARERAEKRHVHLDAGEVDPAIAIMSMNRMAALHPAIISNEITARWATTGHRDLSFDWDETNHKLTELADEVAGIHRRSAGWTYTGSATPGAVQVIFCDLGTPKPGDSRSVYGAVTELLVERGIERHKIAWVHDYPDANKRQPLYDAVRSGEIRVLIGSTAQMGVGVNIQTRLYATHELTTPMRPDELEQAEGRMIRHGNEHPSVELHRYVTERTADAAGWQMLERKQRFITQAMGDPATLTRDLRDESVQTPAEEFATIAAIATGDPRHVQLAALTATVTRLERAERAHGASLTNERRSLDHARRAISVQDDSIRVLTALRPGPIADPTPVGEQLLALTDGAHRVTIAGVAFDISRWPDGMRISLDGVAMRPSVVELPGGSHHLLDPARVRGIGTRIIKMIERTPAVLGEVRTERDRLQAQLDATAARPVPAEFPRRGDLDEARRERDRLRAELMPQQQPTPDESAADESAADHEPPARTGDAHANAPRHPVWAGAEPPAVAQAGWAAAFRHYDPTRQPYWGNRVKGDGWLHFACETLTRNRHEPTERLDLGICRGVAVVGSMPQPGVVRIEIRHHFLRRHTWTGYEAPVATATQAALDRWLARCADHANTISAAQGLTTRPGTAHHDTTNHRAVTHGR